MGSVYRRKRKRRDGRTERDDHYTISYRNESGKWVTEPGYTDKKASQAKLARAEERVARLREGLTVPLSAQDRERRSWTAAVEAYKAELGRLGRAKSYVRQTIQQLTAVGTACGWSAVVEMRPDKLREYLATLSAAGKAAKTTNAYRDAAVSFASWCVSQGWLEANPLSRVPKASLGQPGDISKRPKARRALTIEEYTRLTTCPQIKPARRDLYAVAGLSGLRVDELRHIERGDFTLGDKPRWHVRAEVTKSGRLDRLPMLPECAAVLARIVPADTPPTRRVFRRVPNTRTFERDIARAGIVKRDERGRQADRHSLRYTFCTLVGRVLPIQRVRQLMRHRDIRTTANLYLDLGIEDMADVLEALPPLLEMKGKRP